MALGQYSIIVAGMSGACLLLHLISAGNFRPDEEVWFISNLFWYLHYWLNTCARLALLAVSLVLGIEIYAPGTIARNTSVRNADLSNYITKTLAVAVFCIFIRFILPGPVTSFGMFYKLSFIIAMSAAALTVVATGGNRPKTTTTSRTPSRTDSDKSSEDSDRSIVPPTKRRLTAMELLQTETSYIRNLKIIVEIYKNPLEAAVRKNAPIIDAEDIKQIFGDVNDILAVHMDLHKDLSEVVEDWQENCRIADVITKYQERLTKVYPPYVNYFDMGKEVIVKQQKTNIDFAEFMLNCFNNPTCLKQPLDVLLIRPVQRLPSMSLLIQDLRRRTPEDLDDYEALEMAVDSLKTVLSQINEDKRKTEGRTKIFDIIYQVDGCPENLVSSNRLFVARSDVTTLNDGLYRAGERLALFLLTDVIEVTKWKRSPRKNAPLLKHIMTLPLKSLTSVLDIADCDDNAPMFGIELKDEMVESTGTTPWKPLEKLCVCQPLDGRYHMGSFLKALSEQIAINNDRKSEDVLQNVQPSEVQPMIKKGNKLLRRILSKSKHE